MNLRQHTHRTPLASSLRAGALVRQKRRDVIARRKEWNDAFEKAKRNVAIWEFERECSMAVLAFEAEPGVVHQNPGFRARMERVFAAFKGRL